MIIVLSEMIFSKKSFLVFNWMNKLFHFEIIEIVALLKNNTKLLFSLHCMPQNSRNTAKVGVKHESINQSIIDCMFVSVCF